MPPKPRISLPTKPPPTIKARTAPPFSARPAPKPQASRATPTSRAPHTSWYNNANLRFQTKWTFRIIISGCTLIYIRDQWVYITPIKGASMAPTINPTVHETGQKDWLILRPILHRATNPDDIQRGDIVVFWKTNKPEEAGVKRVVALEGDTVYPQRGYALDPDVLATRRLAGLPDGLPDHDDDSILADREEGGKIVVPYGHVWVEGDNARNSLDSREMGPISKGLIESKAVWIWRGWGRFLQVGDARSEKEKRLGSRVVKGRSEVPAMFLE
ncbi:peptidase S24/S26A/S26B/S26C [Paraphoma chrysanthemicola]|uniref:Mitochondrial inner membrane protease subunit n=1 Tax=Paraphoma chrysanthemicola TaxID=798071 RepID=A0A8K0R3W8_9PLEO|nr:peptidase S24/S26A/S26B/S26C [Paraphoma chrysanthemicola]